MPSDGQTTNEISKPDKDIKLISRFMLIYCRGKHGTKEELCPECRDLLDYAKKRRRVCPLDPKPACKNCPIHCYEPEYREKIRRMMRYLR